MARVEAIFLRNGLTTLQTRSYRARLSARSMKNRSFSPRIAVISRLYFLSLSALFCCFLLRSDSLVMVMVKVSALVRSHQSTLLVASAPCCLPDG